MQAEQAEQAAELDHLIKPGLQALLGPDPAR